MRWTSCRKALLVALCAFLVSSCDAGDSIESSPDVMDVDSKTWNATFGDDGDRPCVVEFYASWWGWQGACSMISSHGMASRLELGVLGTMPAPFTLCSPMDP